MQKVKKVIVKGEDDELAKMFSQMIGETADTSIVFPKYESLRQQCGDIIRVFRILLASDLIQINPSMKITKDSLSAYCDNMAKQHKHMFEELVVDDIQRVIAHYTLNKNFDCLLIPGETTTLPPDVEVKFAKYYADIKNSEMIQSITSMCNELSVYKDNYKDKTILNHTFILNMSGVDWNPLPFKFNIKDLICDMHVRHATIQFIMTMLNKLFHMSFDIYKLISSPDIDVEAFSKLLLDGIDALKKRPELSRCNDAFKKIKESVGLLKDNFGMYYRDFLKTGDNFTILENFIIDVSNNYNAGPSVASQFNTIIRYYHKMMRERDTQDPHMAQLMSKLDTISNQLNSAPNVEKIIRKQDNATVVEPSLTLPGVAMSGDTIKATTISTSGQRSHDQHLGNTDSGSTAQSNSSAKITLKDLPKSAPSIAKSPLKNNSTPRSSSTPSSSTHSNPTPSSSTLSSSTHTNLAHIDNSMHTDSTSDK